MFSEIFQLFGAAFVYITLLMTLFWVIGALKDNAGIVDIGWSLSFFVAIWAYFFLGDGFWFKRLLLAAMVSLWSLRLTWYLWKRFDFFHQDPRYTAIREKLGSELPRFKMFLMFLFQGFLAIILTIPFAVVAAFSTSTWYPIEGLGFLIWLGGFIGEFFADQQLENFKADPANQGKICNQGLWKYSRHPNYFFEWVVWIGYFVFALGSPYGFIAIIAPIVMLILLTRISGIPIAEKRCKNSKGEAYEEYQKKTSAFVPMPPKDEHTT